MRYFEKACAAAVGVVLSLLPDALVAQSGNVLHVWTQHGGQSGTVVRVITTNLHCPQMSHDGSGSPMSRRFVAARSFRSTCALPEMFCGPCPA